MMDGVTTGKPGFRKLMLRLSALLLFLVSASTLHAQATPPFPLQQIGIGAGPNDLAFSDMQADVLDDRAPPIGFDQVLRLHHNITLLIHGFFFVAGLDVGKSGVLLAVPT